MKKDRQIQIVSPALERWIEELHQDLPAMAGQEMEILAQLRRLREKTARLGYLQRRLRYHLDAIELALPPQEFVGKKEN